eukprot:Skav230367  [mRNA]  locus=scaffold4112:352:7335:+ [translate_table: standard]
MTDEGVSRRSQQDYSRLVEFIPNQLWESLRGAQGYRHRAEMLSEFLYDRLQLRLPTEGTYGSMVSAVTGFETNISRFDLHMVLQTTKETWKGLLRRRQKAQPEGRMILLPHLPGQVQQLPAELQAWFQQNPPAAVEDRPFDWQTAQQLASAVPLRGSNGVVVAAQQKPKGFDGAMNLFGALQSFAQYLRPENNLGPDVGGLKNFKLLSPQRRQTGKQNPLALQDGAVREEEMATRAALGLPTSARVPVNGEVPAGTGSVAVPACLGQGRQQDERMSHGHPHASVGGSVPVGVVVPSMAGGVTQGSSALVPAGAVCVSGLPAGTSTNIAGVPVDHGGGDVGGAKVAGAEGSAEAESLQPLAEESHLRDDAASFLRERGGGRMKRPAAATQGTPGKRAKGRPAKAASPKEAKDSAEPKKRPAAKCSAGTVQVTQNFSFKAKSWGDCKAEFYSQKSYLRYYDSSAGKYVMIIGSSAPQHQKICSQLVKHVKAGLSHEDLLRARERIVSWAAHGLTVERRPGDLSLVPVDEARTVVIPELLQVLCARCPDWCRALRTAHAVQGGLLTPVYYHDEITCGNILAVIKRKKLTAYYLSFKEVRPHWDREAAWIPISTLQHAQQDRISGGLSAVMKALVLECQFGRPRDGFDLVLGAETLHFRIAQKGVFLSDQDAQRGTWCTKGSAGLKPCQFCSNVVKKNCLPGSDRFMSIASSDWSAFRRIADEDWLRAYAHLRTLRGKELQDWSKAYGINMETEGIVSSVEAFRALPPSSACNDTMHCYFSNGIASSELSLVQKAMERHGVTLKHIRELAKRTEWRRVRAGTGTTVSTSKLERVLADKMFEGDTYKGDAIDTRPAVYLFQYYLECFFSDTELLVLERQSFASLKRCVEALHDLSLLTKVINEPSQVLRLHEAQIQHQKAFVEAYGECSVRPKHHHRLHIPEATLLLGKLPDTAVHEAKHRVMKGGGLVDNQKHRLSDSYALQTALLPRLLLSTVHHANEHGLATWRLAPPVAAANTEVRQALQDNAMMEASAMTLLHVHICQHEPIFHERRAFTVLRCLRGNAGLLLLLRPWHLIRNHTWGSAWQKDPTTTVLLPVSTETVITQPSWWRQDTDNLLCLH